MSIGEPHLGPVLQDEINSWLGHNSFKNAQALSKNVEYEREKALSCNTNHSSYIMHSTTALRRLYSVDGGRGKACSM